MFPGSFFTTGQRVKEALQKEEGQGMAEYALILALIALVVIGSLTLMGEEARDFYENFAEKISEL